MNLCASCGEPLPPGSSRCEQCGSTAPAPPGAVSEALLATVKILHSEGRKIDAIKAYREETGAGLKEAKEAVEAIGRGEPPAGLGELSLREVEALIRSGHKIGAIKKYREVTGADLRTARQEVERIESGLPAERLNPNLERELAGLLRQGQKIQAIRLHRERTRSGLAEAKRAVEALAAREGIAEPRSGGCLGALLVLLTFATLIAWGAALADDAPRRAPEGWFVHTIDSPRQSRPTTVRVLTPTRLEPGRRYPVVYVLPVEAGDGRRYGDGLAEVAARGLHDRHAAIFVAPNFADLPWYADHPTDPKIRQEGYFLQDVLPLVDSQYPTVRSQAGRLLVGFSKSGWGAFSLLLRHPDLFARAAAWDAPLMMDRPGLYGSGPVFGTEENFRAYQLTRLVERSAPKLGPDLRLIHLGHGNFSEEHRRFEALLNARSVPHRYVDGPRRAHVWESGWLPEAVDGVLGPH